MKLSELQRKDVVNLLDGSLIGRIIDVEFEVDTGSIKSFVIEKNRYFKSMFSNEKDNIINYSQIKKIGNDVILIENVENN